MKLNDPTNKGRQTEKTTADTGRYTLDKKRVIDKKRRHNYI